jgi:cell wall assembly regulator SMI1
VETIWNRIETWLAINAPEILNSLQPGATNQAINKAEAFLDKLPEDAKASYRLHNGQAESGQGLIDAWEFLSLPRRRWTGSG